MPEQPLWTPPADTVANANMTRFMRFVDERHGLGLDGFASLHRFSVERREDFWSAMWDFGGVIGEKGERLLIYGVRMPGAAFFPDAQLNFAENLLRRSDDTDALVFRGEDKVQRRMSWKELNVLVSQLQQVFRAHGVSAGDRVAAMMPNMPESIAAMLAAASIGAIWSSCSPDFGERGVLDRFGQIEPDDTDRLRRLLVRGQAHRGRRQAGFGRSTSCPR